MAKKIFAKKKVKHASGLVLISVLSLLLLMPSFYALDYFVSPSGKDTNAGTALSSPFKTIQVAIDKAIAGDTIHLAAGEYLQSFISKKDGTSSRPVNVVGPSNAIIRGNGAGRIIEINHDYHQFIGFTVDGLAGDPNSQSSYRDKLLYAQGKQSKEGVNGLRLLNMTFKNSGGEAVRLRYFAHDNEIAYCRFENNGVYDFKFSGGGKNGEAIYLGTSSNQWADGKNPTADPDVSTKNLIHHNYFNTQGNECVDIKEGATGNIVEHNICTGQKDPDSAGFDSRGDGNIFRYNEVYGSLGAGVRLGGNTINGYAYGKNNEVYGNKIHDNNYGAIKTMVSPQKYICGNTLSNNGAGYGNYAFDAAAKCPFTTNTVDNATAPLNNTENSTSGNNQSNLNNPGTAGNCTQLQVNQVSALSHDGNVPQNTIDNNLSTRWSAEGDGQWIAYDLGSSRNISYAEISVYKGNSRIQYFDIQLSSDGTSWQNVYSGKSCGTTLGLERFDFPDRVARYLRIVGHKNTQNAWNSLTEVKIWKI